MNEQFWLGVVAGVVCSSTLLSAAFLIARALGLECG